MAAPVWASAGTYLSGTASTLNVAVPSGVVADSVVTVTAFLDSTTTVTAAPSGFTQCTASPADIAANHRLVKYWKRATGADSGTYDFTLSGSAYRNAVAERYSGCVTTGDPWDASPTSATDATNGTVTPSVNITTAGADRLVVWSGSDWAGGTWTPPTGFTERVDQGDGLISVATKTQAVAGATGGVTGTCTGSDKRTAWMGALIPAGAGTITVSPSGIASTAVLGAPVVSVGAVTVSPGGITPGSAVGAPTLSQVVAPTGVASTAALGSPTLTRGAITVTPSGVASTAAVGSPVLTAGGLVVQPSGVASTAAVGSPTVTANSTTVSPTGVASTAQPGTPSLTFGPITITLSGVGSTGAVGSPTVTVTFNGWRLVPPSVTHLFSIRGRLLQSLVEESHVAGDNATLTTYGPSEEIPEDALHVWLGGHRNTTTDPAIRALWISQGYTVEAL
jgi:hypothetical protein